MENIQDNYSKKIISYIGKDPVVSTDVVTRLEYSRNMAIKAALAKKVSPIKVKRNYLTFNMFKNRAVWATGAALALAMLTVPSETYLGTQSSSYADEIGYHISADNILSEFFNDED